ncbi:MAG: type II toxin-antitoxin system RelE/ParE family toxin [Thermoanaerobaculia bacterium]|nr:type II toxin-antitoxin system RelE/ParE family toxin [Thermoanaerobaculia bacterium]
MIKSFADKRSEQLFVDGRSRKFPPELARRVVRKLEYVDLATNIDDLKVPLGNRFHALSRDRKGQFSIAINDQWRICFRFEDGDAYDVEVCDYH